MLSDSPPGNHSRADLTSESGQKRQGIRVPPTMNDIRKQQRMLLWQE
ncbi:hypothetical protein ACFLXY_02085 [Chloroflexota bacterium]